MKYVILFFCLAVSALAQRPHFAGSSPKGVPELAPRFRENNSDPSVNLGNRLGETTNSNAKPLPFDARGDDKLVDRLNTWPDQNKPFWLTNFQAIEEQRGKQSGYNPHDGQPNVNLTNSPRQPVNNNVRPEMTGNQNLESRFGGNSNSDSQGLNSSNSFSIVMGGQWRTYAYDSMADVWRRV